MTARGARRGPTTTRGRRLRHGFLLCLLTGVLGVLGTGPAHADAQDRIDSFSIDYQVQPSGVLHVRETIVYRFGSQSGRHGIRRLLVVRERFDERQDQVYEITGVRVDSPSGASDQFDIEDHSADHGRSKTREIRIGSPNMTVSDPTATYVLDYDVLGALRTSGDYDELYWDATGFDWDATIASVAITASAPGGVTDVRCYAGGVGSTTACPRSEVKAGRAVLGAADLPAGHGVTVGLQLKPGLVADVSPHLRPDGSQLSAPVRTAARIGLGVAGLLTLAVPLLALRHWLRYGRDRRYKGIPPGTTPAPGMETVIGYDDRRVPVPVAFSPPKIPVAEAGVLVDGHLGREEIAATLVDLAVRGAVQLRRNKAGELSVVKVNKARATAPHERVLMQKLFNKAPVRKLDRPGTLAKAAAALTEAVQAQVDAHEWFRARGSLRPVVYLGVAASVVAILSLVPFGAVAVLGILPLLGAGAFAVVWLFRQPGAGPRTAAGRAVCDQVQGFRTYLATAEASQLEFEEGEDIFSRYLPWAIVFDLADRWERICAELVQQGRLPAESPGWYSGSGSATHFEASSFTSTVSSASTSTSSGSSSGTGSGGGSSFSSGGGSAGGGGGGGGGNSW